MSAHKCSMLSNHHSAWPPEKSQDVSYLLDTSTSICTYTRHLLVSTHWCSLQFWRKVGQGSEERWVRKGSWAGNPTTIGFAIQVTFVVNEKVYLFLYSALCALTFTWLLSEGQLQWKSHQHSFSRPWLQWAPCRLHVHINQIQIILGCPRSWASEELKKKKKKHSNCFAQHNKRIPLSEQQGRINSFRGQKKPSHYTVFAVLMLRYKNRTLTYYSWVVLYFTSLYLSSKHNEGGT